MFKTNPDGMRMEPTPERVLSVCRLIAQKKMTNEELRQTLTLNTMGDSTIETINKSVTVALNELGLINKKDKYLELAVPQEVVDTTDAFRRYVSANVFNQKDTTFYMFTKWVISLNERIFSLTDWSVMSKICHQEVSELSQLPENGVYGWRFWATFLGIGYLHGSMIIPNMKLRIQDILATEFAKNFPYEETVRATDFVAWLGGKIPEADLSGKLPLAVSAGLRTLHELGLIKLETWRDSNNVALYYVDGDPINEFSHITVRNEVRL